MLKSNSAGLQILERFVTLVDGKIDPKLTATKYRPRPFFEGVTLVKDASLLRRLTLSMVGRLPTEIQIQTIEEKGLDALDEVLDQIMTKRPSIFA